MKVAMLADIHGNQFALREVIMEIKKYRIDKIVVAGDTVGYYYGIKEVLGGLSQFDTIIVKGNHEGMLGEYCSGLISKNEIQAKYGSSLVRAASELSELEVAFLTSLPHPVSITFDNTNFLISHGAPWDLNEYMYASAKESSWNRFKDLENEIFVLGHTHHPMLIRIFGKCIINPGSVGQSRSKFGLAEWAIYDTETKSYHFHSTPYDVAPLIDQCNEFDPGLSLLTKFLVPQR